MKILFGKATEMLDLRMIPAVLGPRGKFPPPKVFTPLTQLKLLIERIYREYFMEAHTVIAANFCVQFRDFPEQPSFKQFEGTKRQVKISSLWGKSTTAAQGYKTEDGYFEATNP